MRRSVLVGFLLLVTSACPDRELEAERALLRTQIRDLAAEEEQLKRDQSFFAEKCSSTKGREGIAYCEEALRLLRLTTPVVTKRIRKQHELEATWKK